MAGSCSGSTRLDARKAAIKGTGSKAGHGFESKGSPEPDCGFAERMKCPGAKVTGVGMVTRNKIMGQVFISFGSVTCEMHPCPYSREN